MWKIEWTALSARIEALLETTQYFLQSIANDSSDPHNVKSYLLSITGEIVSDLEKFSRNFESQLPKRAKETLAGFLEIYKSRLEKITGFQGIQAVLTRLASFRGEFNYFVTDLEAVGQSLVVRAFTHL